MNVPAAGRPRRHLALAAVVAFALVGPARAQLVIVPTYDSTITGDAKSAAIINTINAAIQEYAQRFSDNMTVTMTFREGGGLGASSTAINGTSYSAYRAALVTHATTANDATALSTSVPLQANSPVDGQSDMWLTRANARALGFSVSSSGADCTITLNTSIMNVDRTAIDPSKYDLKAVTQHEIDEGLGLGSGLNLPLAFPRQSRPQDLFRYSAVHTRSYDTAAASSYFSIDDGVTIELQFNQNGGGDYGDWASSATPHVQDAFGTPGATPNLSNANPLQEYELRNLDVIGYSLVSPVPEPTSLALAAACAAAAGWRAVRRRVIDRTAGSYRPCP